MLPTAFLSSVMKRLKKRHGTRKKEKKQKNKKELRRRRLFNAREELPRGSIPSALPSEDDEDEDMDDEKRCENCPQAYECKLVRMKDCIVIKARNENIDWLSPYGISRG